MKIPCGKYLSLFPDRKLMKKERKENVWRTSGIKERDIDNVFHEWEDNLQTHACPVNFVIDLAHRGFSMAQW